MTPAAKKRLIAQLARQRGLDPEAVLAVASVEGSFQGAIGDGGTSFGPFQLHWGGAMPSQFRGNAKASQQWANSRAGITYAVDQIAKVARGQQGKAAINSIVRRFERPAAPGAEVEKAFSRYGSFGVTGAVPKVRSSTSGTADPAQAMAGESMQSMLAAQLLAQASQTAQGQLGDPSALMGLALMRQQAMAAEPAHDPAAHAAHADNHDFGPPGAIVSPLGTKMPGGSEFHVRDAEGAPGRGGRFHAGKDWFAPAGGAVKSPWGGKVVEVKQSRGNSGQVFGGTVKIQRPDGRVFVARHVDPRKVRVGQTVRPGQLVATVSPWKGGSPHAHIEIWKSLAGGYRLNNMIDPTRVFGGR
jgi:murein DD-endopeptidase MepM/ murein hydrolase activator NlpD